jgi:hypothetical protein
MTHPKRILQPVVTDWQARHMTTEQQSEPADPDRTSSSPGTAIDDDQLPDDLYHYTTAAGLHGILESNTLWGTHAAYLNDSQETLYGMRLALDELKNWHKDRGKKVKAADWNVEVPDWVIKAMNALITSLLGAELQKHTRSMSQHLGPFVTCLSESR